MIEDMTSTAVGALVTCDQLLTENINCLNPLTANPYVLNQLGVVYGVPQGLDTNTSAYVVFSGTVDFIIGQGFTVSDGTYQYTVQAPGGVVGSDGSSAPLLVIATVAGTWAVAASSITTIITSVPVGFTLTVTNPSAGTPSTSTQTLPDYQAQVLQAGLVASTGAPDILKTLLNNIAGVQPRLVSVQQQSPGWLVICGGGDIYAVAYAIYYALFDVSNLVSSTIAVTGVTNANPGVVTTNLFHGLTTGQSNVYVLGTAGITMPASGGPYTVTVITPTTFSIGHDTTSSGAWTSGGVVTPNSRNSSVSISSYPDTYTISFISNPLQQTVTINLVWTSDAPNAVSDVAVQQLGATAIAAYVNSIFAGPYPINLLEAANAFQEAVVGVIQTQYIIGLAWTVYIDGISTAPAMGTQAVYGDPQSYFQCASNAVTITQS
jgi:hypothetical protein